MTLSSAIPSTIYAVTDHFKVLPLTTVSHHEVHGLIKVETSIADDSSESNVFFHESYFKKIYLTPDGQVRDKTLFTDLSLAISFALQCVQEEIDRKNRELNSLTKQKVKLTASLQTMSSGE